MRATDRAREVLRRFPRPLGTLDMEDEIVPAALDFADAVEAALPTKPGTMTASELRCAQALRDFKSALDRATGGEA